MRFIGSLGPLQGFAHVARLGGSSRRISTWSKRGSNTGALRIGYNLHILVQKRWVLDVSASEVTTDATFRYKSFTWRTSSGDRHPYEYIVAQQPAGGATARDALTAVEESLPSPASGWTLVLIPSVSLVCSGKEEMRPLATLLSQRGHRCYILEWPGWTQDVQTNWALEHCKAEHMAEEYQDFWCQALEHVAQQEVQSAKQREHKKDTEAEKPPKLCVVAANSSAIYGLRAVEALSAWEPQEGAAKVGELYKAIVMVAPSWKAPPPNAWFLSRLQRDQAAYWMGAFLHSDSRLGRIYRRSHFSQQNLRRHFPHAGAPDEERLFQLASWFFQRPRPYAQTDAMVTYGFMDPVGVDSVDSLVEEIKAQLSRLKILLLLPESSAKAGAGSQAKDLCDALKDQPGVLEHRVLSSPSLLPHELATSADRKSVV